jgi:hypothetical protein
MYHPIWSPIDCELPVFPKSQSPIFFCAAIAISSKWNSFLPFCAHYQYKIARVVGYCIPPFIGKKQAIQILFINIYPVISSLLDQLQKSSVVGLGFWIPPLSFSYCWYISRSYPLNIPLEAGGTKARRTELTERDIFLYQRGQPTIEPMPGGGYNIERF